MKDKSSDRLSDVNTNGIYVTTCIVRDDNNNVLVWKDKILSHDFIQKSASEQPLFVVTNTLKQLRKRSKLTQKHLSEILGVSQSRISEYETGKVEPGAEIYQRIINICAKYLIM